MNKQTVKKCIEAFNRIETAQDLKREKITQAEHFEIGCTISEYVCARTERSSLIVCAGLCFTRTETTKFCRI